MSCIFSVLFVVFWTGESPLAPLFPSPSVLNCYRLQAKIEQCQGLDVSSYYMKILLDRNYLSFLKVDKLGSRRKNKSGFFSFASDKSELFYGLGSFL